MNRKEGDSFTKILVLLLPILLLGVLFVSAIDNTYPSLPQLNAMRTSSWDNLQSFERVIDVWYPPYMRLVPYPGDKTSYIDFVNNLPSLLSGSPFEPNSNDCPSIFPAPYWISQEPTCLPSDGAMDQDIQYCQDLGTYGYTVETCQGDQDDPQSWDCQTTDYPGGEDACNLHSNGFCYWNEHVCARCRYNSDCPLGTFCNTTTGLCNPNPNSCVPVQYCVGVKGCYNFNTYNGVTNVVDTAGCLSYDPGYQTEVPACTIYTTCGLPFGSACTSDSQCASGYCRNVFNATGLSSIKRCASNATNCVLDTTFPLRALSGEIHCAPNSDSQVMECSDGEWVQPFFTNSFGTITDYRCNFGCNTEFIWYNEDGTFRSIDNAATPLTYVCIDGQSFEWRKTVGSDLILIGTSSPVSPASIEVDAQVSLVVKNALNKDGTFSLYEIDYPDEWTVTNFNLNDNLNSYLSARQTTLVNGVNYTYVSFTFSQALINAMSETEEGSVFELKFEYDYDTGVNESAILYVSRSMSTCSNGIQDGDEGGVDCGGSCPNVCGCDFDGVCEVANNEYQFTCPCDCVPVGEKVLNWSYSPLQLSHYAENSLSVNARIYNPDSQTDTINLYEDDVLGDELIKENLVGTYVTLSCGINYLTYLVHIDTEDFVAANEADNSYEFYFTDGSSDSPILTINLIGEIPKCGDGSCQGSSGEDELTCPQDCGACTEEFLVCGDYKDEGACVSDNCDVSKSHGGECYWNPVSVGCQERVNFQVGGVNIGSCLYSDDTSLDDCSDSFLTYSWTAEWFWDPTNTEHYDPENMEASCVSGEATIPCPAQVQLTYFTWKNLVIAIALILLIYILIKLRQKGKKIKEEARKKKVKRKVVKTSSKKISKKTSKKRVSKKRK